MHVAWPFGFDGRARTTEATEDEYMRDVIEQVLFTQPGERVNRPDFGSGVLQLVFAPNSPELAATTQFLVQAALQQWLGDLIVVNAVTVEANAETLSVSISYVDRRSQQSGNATFTQAVP